MSGGSPPPTRAATRDEAPSRLARFWESPWSLAVAGALSAGLTGLCTVDVAGVDLGGDVAIGEVAPRTVRAMHPFSYTDFGGRDEAAKAAAAAIAPVYAHRLKRADEVSARIADAFTAGRLQLVPGDTATQGAAIEAFRKAVEPHLSDEDIAVLAAAGFPAQAEQLTKHLVGRAMSGYVIADRRDLPVDGVGVVVLELSADGHHEQRLVDRSQIRTPLEAREQITMALLEQKVPAAPWVDAATGIARASVGPNLSLDERETFDRKEAAAGAVEVAVVPVKRGEILFRQGDVIDATDLAEYKALVATATGRGPWSQWAAATAFLGLLFTVLWTFGNARLTDFSTRTRDAAAAGVLLVGTTLAARAIVAMSDGLPALVGLDLQPESVWFLVPLAGAAMLVRLLIGPSWAALFTVAGATACGLVMDLKALHVVYFVITGLVGASAVEHTRERMSVMWAGGFTALVGALAALLAHLVDLVVVGDVGLDLTIRPVWSMAFAAGGGVLSAFVALGLLPLFETAGFVTDYRMLELANLNHPLLRQLMLRAPGSYHHSVIVGSLAEAGCEAIGANALQARVASYFHDIGKANKPQYFVENQRGVANRHDTMDPYVSSRVIIGHVVDGGRMAREHKLPKPIVDNIYMHHGTGILQYFYDRAVQDAHGRPVDEAQFRYPGPKPDTREAGVIMLADKVEAATRTIREPSEESFRAMIHQIINSVMADNQFEKCPLTFHEISLVADTFVKVLLGIHHQRVEYPHTAAISRGNTMPAPPADDVAVRRKGSVITLELPSPKGRVEVARTGTDDAVGEIEEDVTDPDTDYESIQNLPKGTK